jgi:multidrug efflux pump subunit AcrA (membrane-fusion protein)
MNRRASIAIIGFETVLTVLLAACSGDTNVHANRDPVPVMVRAVQRTQERETIYVSGTVSTPKSPAVISFLVSGKVIFVGPREGEYVKEGQVLAQIDPTDFRLSLKAAQAQKDNAHAAMEKAMNPARPEVLEQTRIAYERTQDEYRRMKRLLESGSLASNAFENYRAAYDTARQRYEEAKAGAAKEDKKLSRAAYEQADAHQELAAKALSDSTLYAPVSGYVARRSIEPGDTASAGRPVFEIVQLDTVEASVGVPETDVHLVRIGQRASLKFPALPNRSFEGTVHIVNVTADPGTRTYMTRIRVANPDHVVKIGMVAEARILGDRTISMMTVPGEAIVRDAQGATMVFVYFPEEHRVYGKRVTVGALWDTEVEIKEGLSGDESIVVAGQDYLRDGMPVTIVSRPEGDASGLNRRTAQ